MIGDGKLPLTADEKEAILQRYVRTWDAFLLTIAPERCEHLTAPLSPEGRLLGAIQLSNRKKV